MTWIHALAAALMLFATFALLAFLRLAEQTDSLAAHVEPAPWSPTRHPEPPPTPALAFAPRTARVAQAVAEADPAQPYRHAA